MGRRKIRLKVWLRLLLACATCLAGSFALPTASAAEAAIVWRAAAPRSASNRAETARPTARPSRPNAALLAGHVERGHRRLRARPAPPAHTPLFLTLRTLLI